MSTMSTFKEVVTCMPYLYCSGLINKVQIQYIFQSLQTLLTSLGGHTANHFPRIRALYILPSPHTRTRRDFSHIQFLHSSKLLLLALLSEMPSILTHVCLVNSCSNSTFSSKITPPVCLSWISGLSSSRFSLHFVPVCTGKFVQSCYVVLNTV